MEIRNFTRTPVPRTRFARLASSILKAEGEGREHLSLLFVGKERMRELNKKYRNQDRAANVLSFPGGKEALGEIVLCPMVIAKDAVQYRISFQKALSWMFVHGLLHLLSYEHDTPQKERIMTSREQKYLS